MTGSAALGQLWGIDWEGERLGRIIGLHPHAQLGGMPQREPQRVPQRFPHLDLAVYGEVRADPPSTLIEGSSGFSQGLQLQGVFCHGGGLSARLR